MQWRDYEQTDCGKYCFENSRLYLLGISPVAMFQDLCHTGLPGQPDRHHRVIPTELPTENYSKMVGADGVSSYFSHSIEKCTGDSEELRTISFTRERRETPSFKVSQR